MIRKLRIGILSIMIYAATSAVALSIAAAEDAGAAAGTAISYSDWSDALQKYVGPDGLVDYRSWKNDRAGLDRFLASLSALDPASYQAMSRQEKLAIWINAYNAFTVKVILDNYPIKRSGINLYPSSSIRQIDGAWTRYKVNVAGRSISLSDIENKVLRTELREPLIHFAINCASMSCPKLAPKPYESGKLQAQLEDAARSFINDRSRNRFDPASKRVELSSIFQWYRDDFKQFASKGKARSGRSLAESGVIDFVERFLDAKQKPFLEANDFKITFMPYDWSINERRSSR